ncbi:hypothetical protein [Pseudothioclava arenosa]|uniref:Uncharacterized protein n=1 Tax=Pseudothioclava arenosa TaxID=1795308 RepID=A0A2A4CUQ9_9RHOB|nr:hypothetical protein [Pseudothioclava arenosa]PCD77876.1 hypothetical protein CLN94_00725 [Pseudothioclava arenosa]
MTRNARARRAATLSPLAYALLAGAYSPRTQHVRMQAAETISGAPNAEARWMIDWSERLAQI